MFGKLVSGPWMTLFYTEDAENLAMVHYLKACVTSLTQYTSNPGSFFTPKEDAFGQPLDLEANPVLAAVLDTIDPVDNSMLDTVKSITAAALTVCQKQLKNYLEDKFTDAQRQQARSAPPHNMQAERILAIADSLTHRAPNARVDFMDTKIKARTNNSLVWLEKQPEEKQDQMMRTREVTAEKRIQEKKVEAEVMKRLKEKSRKRDEVERRKTEKAIVAMGKETTRDQLS